MHILFLSAWSPYPPDNGAKIRVNYLLRPLAKTHRVTLVAFDPDLETEPVADGNIVMYPVHADPFRYTQLPQLIKYLSPVPMVFWRIKEMESTINNLPDLGKWDVIVAVQAPVGRYALRFPQIPHILDVDTSLTYQLGERYQRQTTPLNRWRTWLSWYKAHRYERVLFRKFETCTVASPIEVESVQTLMGNRPNVTVLPNGVDCTHHRLGLAEVQPRTLIYNGALTYSANYDAMRYFLAEIYPLIKQKIPDVTLSITGSTKGVDIDGLRLDDSVRLTGYLEDIRLPVAQSAVCIVPLREGGGTRLKILEAMALGTPVVSTSKGAEGLDVLDNEHLLLADTPKAFTDAVLRVMCDKNLYEKLRRNARTLVETHYSWEIIGAQFVDLVETVASAKLPRIPKALGTTEY